MPKRTNGEGTIYQRPNGLWCAELTIGYDNDGKRIKKSFSSMDLEKLQKKVNDEKFKLNRGIVTQNSDYTVGEWVKYWLENYKQHSIRASTYDRYEYAINIHITDTIGKLKLNKIKPDTIQKLYNDMFKKGLSDSSIKKVHIALNQAFKQAMNNELLYQNPCRAVIIPKTTKKTALVLSPEEQSIFLENCPSTTYGNLFVFALSTGMRCGEITALTWSDIDFNNGLINVQRTASTVINRDSSDAKKTKTLISSTKTEKGTRTIPINKNAGVVLIAQKEKGTFFVFGSDNDTMLQKRNIRRALSAILQKSGLPKDITVHSLRHTFATRLLEKGANIKVVSEILGHASIQITLDTYSHVMPNLKKDVISLLD